MATIKIGLLPFKIHTPPVEDFGKLYHRAKPDSGFVKRGGRVPVKRGRVANTAPKPAEFA